MLASFPLMPGLWRLRRASLLAVALAGMLAATGATAQITATKLAWDDMRRAAHLAGLEFVVEGIEQDGADLILQMVTLRPRDAPAGVGLQLDRLRVETNEEGHTVLTPSETGRLVVAGFRGTLRELALEHEGTIGFGFEESASGEIAIDISPSLERFSIDDPGDAAARSARRDWSAFTVGGRAMSGTLSIHTGDASAVGLELRFEGMEYTADQEVMGFLPTRQQTEGATELVTISLQIERPDLLTQTPGLTFDEAFEQGFEAALALELHNSRTAGQQEAPLFSLSMSGTSVSDTLMMTLRDGDFDLSMRGEASTLFADVMGMELDLTFDSYAFTMGAPLTRTAGADRAHLDMALLGITPSPETLAQMDLEEMAGDTVDLELAFSSGVQVTGDLLDLERLLMDDTAPAPLMLSDLALDRLRLRIGDASLQGEGQVSVPEGTPMDDDLPDLAEGAFEFELVGAEGLLTRLGEAGLIAADEMMAARLFLGLLGRNMGDDLYRSEIEIAPGGRLTVNGMPLPF